MKIGVLCPSEIAFRRFMPALQKQTELVYAGVAYAGKDEWFGTPTNAQLAAERDKALNFQTTYGGEVYDGYNALLSDETVDAVYVPLPPALHFEWGKKVLETGKHLFMEKPFTVSLEDTKTLLALAEVKGLAVHENYMFLYHSQLDWIKEKVASGAIGDFRLIRAAFGFPFRGANDFRYSKALGGGALLDCGGYPVRLAFDLLGPDTTVTTSQLCYGRDLEVDLYGTATLANPDGQIAQISFGMDNSYKCELEVWGSTGCILADRIFTAPAGFEPTVKIKTQAGEESFTLEGDDTFLKSIEVFKSCVCDAGIRKKNAQMICEQSKAIQKVMED